MKKVAIIVAILLTMSFMAVFITGLVDSRECIRGCDENGRNCTRECGAGHCVDADDWGYPKVRVSAEEKDLSIIKEPVLNQYVRGIDSGQIILDADEVNLVIQTGKRDQWSSWFGGEINAPSMGADGFDAGRTVPDVECHYILPTGITSSPTSTFASDISPGTYKINNDGCPSLLDRPAPDNYADCRVPCYYRNGMGLYVGIAPNNGSQSSEKDVVLSYHIPDAKVSDASTKYNPNDYDRTAAQHAQAVWDLYVKDGYLIRGKPSEELPGIQTGDRLYFKIVDRTYTDNAGGYTVKIKEGTRAAYPGPLEKISSVFIDPMKIIMNRLYNGIVTNSDFINAVRAMLVIYIALYGYMMMISGMEEAKKEALVRMFKVGIVVQLISPGSWDFFYNYLFAIFLEGTQGIAAVLMNPFGSYDPNDPWYSMDQLLARFWSSETWAKIMSTLLSNTIGILFIPAMALAIGLFMVAVIRALIVYLLAFAGIATLVVIAPIFIVFMLFGQTVRLAKEWLDQLLVFALQQILLMAALGLFAAVIVMFLERTIGYNVCWNIWTTFGSGNVHILDLQFWMPDISMDKANIWMDADGDGIRGPNEIASRYIDMPYLDPAYDVSEISKYSSESNFLEITDILILLASIFLMSKFMTMIPAIAGALKAGISSESMNIFGSGNQLFGALVGAGMEMGSGAINAFKSARSTGKDLASNAEAKHAAGSVKRGGIRAGRFAATNAASAGNWTANKASAAGQWTANKASAAATALGNTTAGKYASWGVSRAGEKISDRASSVGNRLLSKVSSSKRSADAKDAHARMSTAANAASLQGHGSKDFSSKDTGYTPHMMGGAGLADKGILDKGDVTKRGELMRAQGAQQVGKAKEFENKANEFAKSIAKFASNAEMDFMKGDNKKLLEAAKPAFAALSDEKLAAGAIRSLAMNKDMDKIVKGLREVLNKTNAAGSELNPEMIRANLDALEKASKDSRTVRTGVIDPKAWGAIQGSGPAGEIKREGEAKVQAPAVPVVEAPKAPERVTLVPKGSEKAKAAIPKEAKPDKELKPAVRVAGTKLVDDLASEKKRSEEKEASELRIEEARKARAAEEQAQKDALAYAEATKKAAAEAEVKAKADKEKLEGESQIAAEAAEIRSKEAEAKTKAEAEAKARIEAEAKAKEDKAKKEALIFELTKKIKKLEGELEKAPNMVAKAKIQKDIDDAQREMPND